MYISDCCFNIYALTPLQTPALSRISRKISRERGACRNWTTIPQEILSDVCIYGLRLPKGRFEAPRGDRMRISLTHNFSGIVLIE